MSDGAYFSEDGSCSLTRMTHVARQCWDNGRGQVAGKSTRNLRVAKLT